LKSPNQHENAVNRDRGKIIQPPMSKTLAVTRGLSLVAGLAFVSAPAPAQDTGHYIQGAAGLDNGTLPPPGMYFTYLLVWCPRNT
jgi:hypothetical protein